MQQLEVSALPVESRGDDQKRRWRRYPFNSYVTIQAPFRTTAVAHNLSARGIRLSLERNLLVGELCLLSLDGKPELARVVWNQRFVDGCLVGLEFVDESAAEEWVSMA